MSTRTSISAFPTDSSSHDTSMRRAKSAWSAIKSRFTAFLCAAAAALTIGYSDTASAEGMAVAPLPDGRLQLFVVMHGELFTAWKRTPDPNADWTPLTIFSPHTVGRVRDVTVGVLPDGRLQLFVIGSDGLTTSWKVFRNPNAAWTEWSPL